MKILLLGANGQLGCELSRQLSIVGIVHSFTKALLDITNHNAVTKVVNDIHPDIIINAAAYTDVDRAEDNKDIVFAINSKAVEHLAKLAKIESAWLIHYSTEYVFDGAKSTPYNETDVTSPLNVYGSSKLSGEEFIKCINCKHLIFRSTWIIGKDGHNFAKTILKLASERHSLQVISDQVGVPTSTALITKVTIDAIRSIAMKKAWEQGIYHVVPKGVSSWYNVAQTIVSYAEQHGCLINTKKIDIKAIKTADYKATAKRPLNSQLDTSKLHAQLTFKLPHWKEDFLFVFKDILKEYNYL